MNSKVICFGEVLWDLLPSGKVAGGAPMNVAFQLNQLGFAAGMISRIGEDELGNEIFQFLKSKNVPTEFVQRDTAHPTGIVQVELNEKGHPQYEIVQEVAWDYICAEEPAKAAVRHAEVFVFGSLVARHESSKQTLLELIGLANLRVFDVNLRQPFYSKSLLDELLLKADIVKMNDDELDIIAAWHDFQGDQRDKMTMVKSHFGLEWLIVTRGENGAVTLGPNGFCSHPGFQGEVQDTIGSGDAFLAGWLSRFLAKDAPAACLEFACKMGAYVATQRGGTPVYNENALTFTN